MKQSNILLWGLVISFLALVLWLVATGRLENVANSLVNAYWKFMEGFPKIHIRGG